LLSALYSLVQFTPEVYFLKRRSQNHLKVSKSHVHQITATKILCAKGNQVIKLSTPVDAMSGFFSWSPFSRSQPPVADDTPETIELRHGKQTYQLTFRPGKLSTLAVSELKSLARQQAKLADDVDIRLLFQGRRMEDNDLVGKYNVHGGSRILMTSGKKFEKPAMSSGGSTLDATTTTTNSKTSSTSSLNARQTAPAVKPVTPQTPLDKIAAIRLGIKNTYGDQIKAFVKNPPHTRKERVDTKARLSELLLQQLLRFDDVIVDPDDYASKEARQERKAAIKWVQGLMEEVDGVDVDGTS
jgi:hypothetical protein